jgi:colanic acid/amylovoran biosynthesis protein
MRDKIKIGLLWHNLNSENYGVSALAIAHISMLSELCKENSLTVEFLSIGTPSVDGLCIQQKLESYLDVKIKQKNFSVKGMARGFFTNSEEFSCDIYFDLGEGDSFTDIYGSRRFFNLSTSKVFLLLRRKKLVLSPQTYGPFKSKLTRFISKTILKKCNVIFSRDYKSTKILNDINVNSTEVADVAFSLPYDSNVQRPNSVGLNVSGLLWNGGYTGNNQFGLIADYKSLIEEVIGWFLSEGKSVHLISHVISDKFEAEDDYRACQYIKDVIFCDSSNVILAPKFKDPMEAKSYISSMKFFMGSRMHATIAALSSGVPVLPLAYSRKFEGVFGSIGYQYNINLHERTNMECMVDIKQCLSNSDELLKNVNISRENALNSNNVYKDELDKVLKNAFK